MKFLYEGPIPASKSMLNRCLILKSHAPSLNILGNSKCDDVIKMQKGLKSLAASDAMDCGAMDCGAMDCGAMDCGAAGTTFRFLTLRASRQPGEWLLKGSQRLLSRPHDGLLFLLNQLNVEANLIEKGLQLISSGWSWSSEVAIEVDCSKSSQFASALLLNAWGLNQPLNIRLVKADLSQGYLDMTIDLVKKAGMQLEYKGDLIKIPENQKVTVSQLEAEADLSSVFAVAAVGAISTGVKITNFPQQSLQPDKVFVEILKSINVPIDRKGSELTIYPVEKLNSISWNLGDCPDLFPVLSVLCCFAEGRSHLYGAPHLVYKESDRLGKSAELIKKLGRRVEMHNDGLTIFGKAQKPNCSFEFDPDHDHRLAFAAALAKAFGASVDIQHKDVVNKSFPEFWDVVGGAL